MYGGLVLTGRFFVLAGGGFGVLFHGRAGLGGSLYTATFGSVEAPAETSAPVKEDPEPTTGQDVEPAGQDKPAAAFDWTKLKTPLMIGGVLLILAGGGAFAIKMIRRR